jgi:hypothetical protein
LNSRSIVIEALRVTWLVLLRNAFATAVDTLVLVEARAVRWVGRVGGREQLMVTLLRAHGGRLRHWRLLLLSRHADAGAHPITAPRAAGRMLPGTAAFICGIIGAAPGIAPRRRRRSCRHATGTSRRR